MHVHTCVFVRQCVRVCILRVSVRQRLKISKEQLNTIYISMAFTKFDKVNNNEQ